MKKRMLAMLLVVSLMASLFAINASATITGTAFEQKATITSASNTISVSLKTAVGYTANDVVFAYLFNAEQQAFYDDTADADGFLGEGGGFNYDSSKKPNENDYLWKSTTIPGVANVGDAISFSFAQSICTKTNGFDSTNTADTQEYTLYIMDGGANANTAQSYKFTTDADGTVQVDKATYTLDMNGGTLEDKDGNAITSAAIPVGTYATAAALKTAVGYTPTKANCNFEGWTTTNGGTTAEGLTIADKTATGTLYAVWSDKTPPAAGDFEVTGSYVYTGEAQKPTVAVKDTVTGMGAITVKDSSKQTNAGTYSVDISVAEATYASGDVTLADAWTIAPAKPTFTFAGKDADTPIAEGTLLKDIVVTVKGVGAEVLGAGTHVWKDKDGNTLDADTTAVAPETEYIYTYTPDATESNYTTNSGKYVLGQTKATVKFEVAAADADKGSIAAADATAEFDKDAAVKFPTVTLKEGFTLKGWTVKGGDGKLVDTAAAKAVDGTVYVAVFEAKPSHKAYMQGTDLQTPNFEPSRDMTRAEVAIMIANLEEYDEKEDYAAKLEKIPADLQAAKGYLSSWTGNAYNKICFVISEKIMQGRTDGNFDLNAKITRQEMAIVLGKYLGIEQKTGENLFNDLNSPKVYAEGKGYINALKDKGKIDGFTDGGYHPTENLTRAQAAKMMNSAMDRAPDIAKMKAAKVTTNFKDVQPLVGNDQADWAVYNIIEATTGHLVEAYH